MSRLKSEWCVRLLIKELRIDRSINRPLTDEEMDRITRLAARDKLCSNDAAASKLLYDMALTPLPKINTATKEGIAVMRKWADDHEDQIPQLLKKKYGDLAVLNSEMVVAVDRKNHIPTLSKSVS
ncbi:MAG: hypothetical protein ACPG32_11100 [Akkermansiaceae bacterium]